VTAFLVSQGLGTGALGLNGPLWSALLAVIAGLLGTVFLARFRDVAFALVLLWALYGVYAARPDVWAVGVGTALAAALLVLGVVGTLRRRRLAGSRV
jgi:hypothetical protein